jgi:hypothetical protein
VFRSFVFGGISEGHFFEVVEAVGIKDCLKDEAWAFPQTENNNNVKWQSMALKDFAPSRYLKMKAAQNQYTVNELDENITVQTHLDAWEAFYELRSKGVNTVCPLTLLYVGFPFSLLAAFGQLKTLGLSARQSHNKNSPLHQYFDTVKRLFYKEQLPEPPIGVPLACESDEPANVHGAAMFEELSNFIKGLVNKELEPRDNLTQEEEAALAESWVMWLQRLQRCHDPKELMAYSWLPLKEDGIRRGGHWQKHAGQHGRFNPPFFYDALRCYMSTFIHTKVDAEGNTHLKALMVKMIMLLPPHLQAELQHDLRILPVPGRRALEMGRLFYDTTYMIMMREQHKRFVQDGTICFPLADSSSVRGKSVMMYEYFYIQGGQLLQAANAAMELKHLPRDRGLSLEEIQVSDYNCLIIESSTGHHTMPPTYMGQGHSKLVHRLACILQANRLENWSWKLVGDFVKDCCFCWCTDTGTEKKFRKSKVKVKEMFSWWSDEPVQLLPDGGMDVPEPDDVDAGQNENDGPVIDFRDALGFRGLMHTINKVQEHVLRAIPTWALETLPLLSSLAIYFGNKLTRNESVESGLRRGGHDVYATYHHLFDSGPSPLEGGKI